MLEKQKSWSEDIEKELKQNDFFSLIEKYFKINKIDITWENIDSFIAVFLKDEENRYEIEEFLINYNNLNNDSLNFNLKILSDIDNFYKWNNSKNYEYQIANNIDFKKTEDQLFLEKSQENIVKKLIQEWNIKNRIQYVLEEDLSLRLNLKKWTLTALDFFKIKINGVTKIFTKDLNQMDGKDLLLMMNVWKDSKIKHLEFDYFSDWLITEIVSFNDFYWKKIIGINYIDNNDKGTKIKGCYLTDDWDILSLDGKYYIRRFFWEIDVLWKKFVWAWITNSFEFMLDLTFKPIIIWNIYLKTFEKINMSFKWNNYFMLNNWEMIISENDFIASLDKYVSFDIDNSLVEEIYE